MDKLRKLVQEMITEELQKELDEVSTSAAAGPYLTPNAFTKKGSETAVVKKKLGWTPDHTLAEEETERVDEARSKYNTYKMDDSATTPQKIGRAITEINRRLNEIDDLLEMNARLKTEQNLGSTGLWKRTMKHLTRMENKILRMSQRLKELKS